METGGSSHSPAGPTKRRAQPAALKKPAGTALKPSSFVSPLSRSFFMRIGGSRHSLAGSRKRKGRSRAERALKRTCRAEEKKIIADLGKCLRPVVSEFGLRWGVAKEVYAHMIATRTGRVRVYEGHPFLVQAAVSIGASNSFKQGVNTFHFERGNSQKLVLFKPGAHAATEIALKRINWSAYKIDQVQDKICVFVCIVGANIPSTGTANEYIATAVKSVIQQCCYELRSNITEEMQPKGESTLEMSIADAADELYELVRYLTKDCPHLDSAEAKEMYSLFSSGAVTREVLREKFRKIVTDGEELTDGSGVSEEPTEEG